MGQKDLCLTVLFKGDIKVIELRSDTFTQADEKMRKAMADAVVGDDVYQEDPSVNNLQNRAAEIFSKEAALFVPSGTMGNLLAVLSTCQRGDEIIMENTMHTFLYEVAGISALAGVQIYPVPGNDGKIPLYSINSGIRPENIHFPATKMIALENTHNMSGGKVLDLDYINAVGQLAKEKNIHFHIDGARIFNAITELGVTASEMVQNVDSIQVCLSKGLGAPMGSMLIGKTDFIDKARKYRKMLGGGMRQWGHAAAAGIIALEEGPKKLLDDHINCGEIAEALVTKTWTKDVTYSTNICRFQVIDMKTADNFTEYMNGNHVRVQRTGDTFRIVTHFNVSKADTLKVVSLINSFKGDKF